MALPPTCPSVCDQMPVQIFSLVWKKSVLTLLSELVEFAALPIELGLIGIDLPLLIALSVLLSLKLIADQCAAAETQRTADRRAGTRMADCRADNAACSSAAQCAD